MLKPVNEVDLGSLKYGESTSFEVDLVNTIAKNMVINKVRVSCHSCTKANAPRQIGANSSGKLKVTYTPGSLGAQSKWVDIVYDEDQSLRVYFKAQVHD